MLHLETDISFLDAVFLLIILLLSTSIILTVITKLIIN